jgi:hypothetical protein
MEMIKNKRPASLSLMDVQFAAHTRNTILLDIPWGYSATDMLKHMHSFKPLWPIV